MSRAQSSNNSPHGFDTGGLQSRWHAVCLLAVLFLVAFAPRFYSAQTLGWDWDRPGSFTLVNFDEGGSCRAALDGFDYTPFIGQQTIAMASALGHAPAPAIFGNERLAKAYCHSPLHVKVARTYSAVTGALTVVVIVLLSWALVPTSPAVGWTAGALLAFSPFHLGESHSGTVDAPSTFFIYFFLLMLVRAVNRGGGGRIAWSLPFAVFAVWTKYWVFALLAYLICLPLRVWRYVTQGLSPANLVLITLGAAALFGLMSNREFRESGQYWVLALWYLLVPWWRLRLPMAVCFLAMPPLIYALGQVDIIQRFTTSGPTSPFGSGYAAIGWHKWPRNFFNLPMMLLIALGIPAALCLPAGIRALLRGEGNLLAWCCLLPLLAFLLFMAFVSPITYYRHYLPLVPVATVLAAWGFFSLASNASVLVRRAALAVFLLWPMFTAVDLVSDYHRDPRIALRTWYAENPGARVFSSFYVSPPPGGTTLFRPEYAAGDAAALRQGDYLILSENWYDTAYPNELNGPLAGDLNRLIKTTPQYTLFYRQVLSGNHPLLQPELALEIPSFMPELLLHRRIYGNFQLFVGDLRIFKIVK